MGNLAGMSLSCGRSSRRVFHGNRRRNQGNGLLRVRRLGAKSTVQCQSELYSLGHSHGSGHVDFWYLSGFVSLGPLDSVHLDSPSRFVFGCDWPSRNNSSQAKAKAATMEGSTVSLNLKRKMRCPEGQRILRESYLLWLRLAEATPGRTTRSPHRPPRLSSTTLPNAPAQP